jgi:hypothetical protein
MASSFSVRRAARYDLLVKSGLVLLAVIVVYEGCTPSSHVTVTRHDGARVVTPAPPSAPEGNANSPLEVESYADDDAREPTRPSPLRRPGSYANVDPDDDFVVGPPDALANCEAELKEAGVGFHAATLTVHEQKKSHIVCGAPQVVTYVRGPANITYNSPPLVTCTMALALASFEKIAQEEARAVLHSTIVRIDHLGTYSCREMLAYKGWVSEHSYANAIDIARFVLKDGRSVEVLRDFDTSDDTPKKAAGAFLRNVSRRANDEDVFSHVLTPFFDALHKNHFHLDLARYRTDGTRPRS